MEKIGFGPSLGKFGHIWETDGPTRLNSGQHRSKLGQTRPKSGKKLEHRRHIRRGHMSGTWAALRRHLDGTWAACVSRRVVPSGSVDDKGHPRTARSSTSRFLPERWRSRLGFGRCFVLVRLSFWARGRLSKFLRDPADRIETSRIAPTAKIAGGTSRCRPNPSHGRDASNEDPAD